MDKVIVKEKLSSIPTFWDPKIAGEVNGQLVKLVKIKGEFVWHKHDREDELFYVIHGELKMNFRDKIIYVKEHEFIVVPKGVEHKPEASEEVWVMLIEPASTLNTGNVVNEFTKTTLERI
jgi:mannose-6-phosphate isomerase-like protein (cupin superfamily)